LRAIEARPEGRGASQKAKMGAEVTRATHKRIAILAATATLLFAAPARANFLDTFLHQYQTASSSWDSSLTNAATRLFWLLASIEFAAGAINWVLQNSDVQSFSAAMIRKIIGISGFYLLLIGATSASPFGEPWPQAIMDSFTQLGAQAAGNSSPYIGTTTSPGSPGQVFMVGIQIAVQVVTVSESLSGLLNGPFYAFVSASVALVIVSAFAFITTLIIITLIESYIVLHAGILLLGLGGSRYTQDFVNKYFAYAMAVGIKIFTLYLIVGIGTTISSNWIQQISSISDIADLLQALFSLTAGTIVFCYLTYSIPTIAGTMLSGSPQLSAGGLIGAGLSVAGTAASGLIGAGALGSAALGLSGAGAAGGQGGEALASALRSTGGGASGGAFSSPASGGLGLPGAGGQQALPGPLPRLPPPSAAGGSGSGGGGGRPGGGGDSSTLAASAVSAAPPTMQGEIQPPPFASGGAAEGQAGSVSPPSAGQALATQATATDLEWTDVPGLPVEVAASEPHGSLIEGSYTEVPTSGGPSATGSPTPNDRPGPDGQWSHQNREPPRVPDEGGVAMGVSIGFEHPRE
jgi:type IV secretion system protein TrbL